MEGKPRKTGIDILGDASWGTHFCHFYNTREDLLDILVPYFKAGLENNEFCMWVTSEALSGEEAGEAMTGAVPDFGKYLAKNQIEILPYTEWYLQDGVFDIHRILNGWIEKQNLASARGFDGLRLTGDTIWLEKDSWKSFSEYEKAVNNIIGDYKMLAVCTYPLGKCSTREIIDVVSNHQFALIKHENEWDIIENGRYRRTEDLYRTLVELVSEWIWETDTDFTLTYVSPRSYGIIGYKPEELLGKKPACFMPPEETARLMDILTGCASQKKSISSFENICVHKDGHLVFQETNGVPFFGKNGNLLGYRGSNRDITERKKSEKELKKSKSKLALKSRSLEEMNIALKVLLKQREEDKSEIEENVTYNVKKLVLPYIESLKLSHLNEKQMLNLEVLEANLIEIVSPFLRTMTMQNLHFTPREIEIINLIKIGRTTKEIASLLNVGKGAVDFHRGHIRKRLGLNNKKVNLRSYLSSLL